MKLAILSSAVWGSVFIKENMTSLETTQLTEGLELSSGKLNGLELFLVEQSGELPAGFADLLSGQIRPDCVISLAEAHSTKKSLDPGDIVISSAAYYIDSRELIKLTEIKSELKLIDSGIKAVEKFNLDDSTCKVVVGGVLLHQEKTKNGLKQLAVQDDRIYCTDIKRPSLSLWAIGLKVPFVLVRTVIPVRQRQGQAETSHFKWDMAKRNFWIVKGIIEGLKKKNPGESVRKVDLI